MKRRLGKAVSLFVTLSFLLSMFSGIPVVNAATVFSTDTLIEAEDTTLGKGAIKADDKGATGKAITSDGDRVDDPAAVKNPDIVFSFKVPAEGTYGVYAKVKILDGGRDSYHFKFDGDDWETVHPGEKGENYVWLKLAEKNLTAGDHMFYWTHREVKAFYDSFFVTTDASKLPAIDGGSTTPGASSTPDTPSTGTEQLKQFKLEGGSVLFEAEEATTKKELVSIVDAPSASGKKAVLMNKDDRNAPAKTAEAGLGFELVTDKKGSYAVWARMVVKTDGNDSCWLSANGGDYKDTWLPSGSKDDNDYQWSKITSITLEANTPGSVRIIPRETGAMIDRFVITNNTAYIPTGMGEKPQEVAGGTVIKLPEDKYPKPSITPPSEHPRLLFKASDIDTIRKNMESAEEAAAVAEFNTMKDTAFDGNLEPKTPNNYDGKKLAIIEAKAFDYVFNGNEENGKNAITAIKNYISTCTYDGMADNTRAMGHVLFTAAEVYDWCYPLLSAEDKAAIVSGCQVIGMGMEIGFPPSGQGAVVGHGGEAQLMRDWLSLGVATYDEYPDIYNFVAGRYLSEFTKSRNYYFTSELQHQGSAYGPYRYLFDLWGQWIMYRMSGEQVYIDQAGKVPYQWIYTRRPDGQLLREGDEFNEGAAKGKYWNCLGNMPFYAANFYKDPILKKQFLRDNPDMANFTYSNNTLTPVQIMIFNDPSIGKEDIATLPQTKYFGSPAGQMVARTGWDMGMNSPDVLAFMKIGEVWAANHNHLDVGNFQIYYKGILASESGYYESYGTNHDGNYNKESIAHNVLHIYDPNETGSAAKSGGQRRPGGEPNTYETWMKDDNYKMAEVTGHEFGPNTMTPEYSYIAGDITKAYTDKVSEVLRSMLFLPTGDEEHPAAFIVFDKVTSKNKDAKKTFMLHMQQEPTVDGNVSIIKRDTDGYNGMLTNQTLLPASANIEKIGGEGKQYWIGDQNYDTQKPISNETAIEAGWGRIEISPKEANNTDYFLNVMYVNDADKDLALEKAELIENDTVAGAKILDRVAVFNKNKDRIGDSVSFDVPGSETELKVNVAGLKAGTWSVKVNGTEVSKQVASEDGGIIYFTAPAGKYELTYSSSDSNKTFEQGTAPETEGIAVKLNGNYLYSDVPPMTINDRALVPMRAIFEALNAEVTWDEATGTATAKNSYTSIKLVEGQTQAFIGENPTELEVPAQIINDRFLVPIRFVAESLGATVNWEESGQVINIAARMETKKWDIPDQVEIKTAVQSGDDGDGNTILNSFDGLLSTRWAPEGKDGAAWGVYDFGSVFTLDKMHLSFYNGDARTYYFSIAVSEDGVNYTTVIDKGQSSGKTNELEIYDLKGAKARYVKYIGGGNSVNLWNSVTEIVFTEKK